MGWFTIAYPSLWREYEIVSTINLFWVGFTCCIVFPWEFGLGVVYNEGFSSNLNINSFWLNGSFSLSPAGDYRNGVISIILR